MLPLKVDNNVKSILAIPRLMEYVGLISIIYINVSDHCFWYTYFQIHILESFLFRFLSFKKNEE